MTQTLAERFGKVLIIGAGLGGLALAQALHQAGIPFELFERDTAPTGRKQGWAITLMEALPALLDCLDEESRSKIRSTSVNHNVDAYDEFGFVDAMTGERVALTGGKPIGEPGSFIRANRAALRTFLWEANSLPVTAGKRFSHYEEDASGVTAFFFDGTTARGTLLIGADGLNSCVRSNLLESNCVPVLADYIPLAGELDLTREQFEPYQSIANAGFLCAGKGLRYLISNLAIEDDRSSARYFYSIMARRNPEDESNAELADWIRTASKEELCQYALRTCDKAGVHGPLRELITIGGPEAILDYQPRFLEFLTPDTMPAGRVTLLGDAAHAMLPFRGAGANAAILDGADLAELLTDAYAGGRDAATVVGKYLETMIPRGKEAVLSSRMGGDPAMDSPAEYFKNFQRKM